jgi:uncharacterized membrane protein
MKKLLSTGVLALSITFSGAAQAHMDWYGKEGQDEKPSYMENALSKLPPQKASDFRDTMKESDEENKNSQEQVYRLHNDLHAILTAPVFDRNAFLAKRADLQKLHEKMEENRADAFAAAVSDLSQAERVTLTRDLHHVNSHNRHTAQIQKDDTYSGEPATSIKH